MIKSYNINAFNSYHQSHIPTLGVCTAIQNHSNLNSVVIQLDATKNFAALDEE